tara:strand:+ start:824 stop:964 length:141 start_codon:yes stop_codon:yes gene_type:complete
MYRVLYGQCTKNYSTEDGHIEIAAMVDGKPAKAESHKLALYLDYEV